MIPRVSRSAVPRFTPPRHAVSRVAAAGAGLLLTLGAAGAAAAATPDPVPVGPNQFFNGVVNGQTANATIKTSCVGPVVPGQTGHPLAGQDVEAVLGNGTTTPSGYTGSAATSLLVTLASSTSVTSTVGRITAYYVPLAIPTSITVPCAGTGTATFTPQPTSSTAKAATVTVTFVGQP